MDLSGTVEPKSDQLNADDLITGPRTFTVERVSAGSSEQPVNVHLAELPGRPYRPSKTMRRLLIAAWGQDGSAYVGRALTLYRNPDIKFGGIAVGGIEISAMSHIDKPLNVSLTATRGKKKGYTVEPLQQSQPQAPLDVDSRIQAANGDPAQLRELWTEARDAGAPQDVLDRIQAAAQPPAQGPVQDELGGDAA